MHEFSNLPGNAADFYKKRDEAPATDPKDKKKDKKEDGGKKPKKNEIDKFIDEHDVIGPTETVLKVQENVKDYSENWGTRDNSEVSEEIFNT